MTPAVIGIVTAGSKHSALIAILLAPAASWLASAVCLIIYGLPDHVGAGAGVLIYTPGFFCYFSIPAIVICHFAQTFARKQVTPNSSS